MYKTEISQLFCIHEVSKGSPLRKLDSIHNPENLRVGGRLNYPSMSENQEHPPILPSLGYQNLWQSSILR